MTITLRKPAIVAPLTAARKPAIAIPLTAVLAATLVGCADDSNDELPPPPPPQTEPAEEPAPASTLSPAEQEAVDEILAVFDGYREAEIKAAANPQRITEVQEQLRDYMVAPVRNIIASGIETMEFLGIARVGRPTWEATVTELQLGAYSTATVRDCVDASDWQIIDHSGGDPAPAEDGALPHFPGPLPDRYVMTFTATIYTVDGERRWLLEEGQVEREKEC